MHIKILAGNIREPQWKSTINEDIYVTVKKHYITEATEFTERELKAILQISTASNRDTTGKTPDLPNGIQVELTDDKELWLPSIYNLVAEKVREEIIKNNPNVSNLGEEDVKVEVEEGWATDFGTNLVIPRPIRVTIPKDLLITTYESLLTRIKQGWRDDGVSEEDFPFSMNEDSVTVYFANLETASVEEITALQSDINVIIETL